MKFIAKEQPISQLEKGDVIEWRTVDGGTESYLVIRAWDSEGLWGYGLINLRDADQLPQLFDEIDDVIKQFVNYEYRIIKSSNLELREV